MKPLRCWYFFIPLFWASLSFAASSFQSALDSDLNSGIIDRAAAATYKAYSLYLPQNLPVRYRGLPRPGYLKGASIAALSVWKNLALLKPADRQAILKAMARPDNLTDQTRTTNHFTIHYTLTGLHASLPDYIDTVAAVLEYCWAYEIDTLQYKAPPVSGNYDVYIIDIKSYYGYYYGLTQLEGVNGGSYLTLDNNYSEFPTQGLNGLKVTAAHEFFHAVQYGYTYFPYEYTDRGYAWWMEICSVWMEETVYDEINDYYNYLYDTSEGIKPWFQIPHNSLISLDNWHEYGSCLFNFFLEKKYGAAFIRRVWETNELDQHLLPREALDDLLTTKTYNSSFAQAYREFAAWNYFTGSRADTVNFYAEGDTYPEILIDSTYHIHHVDSTTTLSWPVFIPNLPDSFGTNYIVINGISFFDSLDVIRIVFNDSGNSMWNVSIIIQDTTGNYADSHLTMLGNKAGAYDLENPGSVERVVLAVNRLSAQGQPWYTYGLQLEVMSVAKTTIYQAFPNPYKPGEHERVYFPMSLAKPVETITVRVLSQNGDLVRKLVFDQGFFPYSYTRKQDLESNKLYWDGLNSNRNPVASGFYFYHVQMDKNTYSGTKKISIVR